MMTDFLNEVQCWGKLLLKVMHYNIALLPKKVTNYVTFTLQSDNEEEPNCLSQLC